MLSACGRRVESLDGTDPGAAWTSPGSAATGDAATATGAAAIPGDEVTNDGTPASPADPVTDVAGGSRGNARGNPPGNSASGDGNGTTNGVRRGQERRAADDPGEVAPPDAPLPTQEAELARAALDAHNAIRAGVPTASPLPPLQWSDDLAALAQDWADTLATQCADGTLPDGMLYRRPDVELGENIYVRFSRPFAVRTPIDEAVGSWSDEAQCWQYGTLPGADGSGGTAVCDAECLQDNGIPSSGTCKQYTQLVWEQTTHVGCGFSRCVGDYEGQEWNWSLWVCNYDPPGNAAGQAPY